VGKPHWLNDEPTYVANQDTSIQIVKRIVPVVNKNRKKLRQWSLEFPGVTFENGSLVKRGRGLRLGKLLRGEGRFGDRGLRMPYNPPFGRGAGDGRRGIAGKPGGNS
jgi:hypothetical protein